MPNCKRLSKGGSPMNEPGGTSTTTTLEADDRLVSPKELQHYLGCSRNHVQQLLASGEIPSFKVRNLRRVRKVDLDAYIEARIAEARKG
jgi:excisionase family DNA binding protein